MRKRVHLWPKKELQWHKKLQQSWTISKAVLCPPASLETAPSTNKISRVVLLGRRGAGAADRENLYPSRSNSKWYTSVHLCSALSFPLHSYNHRIASGSIWTTQQRPQPRMHCQEIKEEIDWNNQRLRCPTMPVLSAHLFSRGYAQERGGCSQTYLSSNVRWQKHVMLVVLWSTTILITPNLIVLLQIWLISISFEKIVDGRCM